MYINDYFSVFQFVDDYTLEQSAFMPTEVIAQGAFLVSEDSIRYRACPKSKVAGLNNWDLPVYSALIFKDAPLKPVFKSDPEYDEAMAFVEEEREKFKRGSR